MGSQFLTDGDWREIGRVKYEEQHVYVALKTALNAEIRTN